MVGAMVNFQQPSAYATITNLALSARLRPLASVLLFSSVRNPSLVVSRLDL
jgi:hypothetical protein